MPLAAEGRYAPDFDATPGEYPGLLNTHGCSHCVLVQPSFLGCDNSYLLRVLGPQPESMFVVVRGDFCQQSGRNGVRQYSMRMSEEEAADVLLIVGASPPWRPLWAQKTVDSLPRREKLPGQGPVEQAQYLLPDASE